jgi:peroxiredoxin
MPSLVKLQSDLKDRVVVLAVSVDDDERSYRNFLKKNNVDLLTVRDPQQKSNELYGSFKFPETYIIDRNGVVQRKFIGPVDWTRPDVVEYLTKL